MKLGVEIGGTKSAVVLGNDKEVVAKIRFDTTDCEGTVAEILRAAKQLMAQSTEAVTSIGVSCGGPLDSTSGVILSPPNLPGWDAVPITDMLQDACGIPAYLCNDANACALAEWKYGAGRGCRNMIFLTFGTGLGAGLILDGKLYEGTNGMAGEVGHIRLSAFGPVGYGKAGSFEGFCSGAGLAQIGKMLTQERIQLGKSVALQPEDITAKTLAEAAVAGDAIAIEAYRICGEQLGRGLSILVDVLNPERIVIGSVFARAEQLLRPSMEQALQRDALAQSCEVCRVVPAELGEQIGDYAALAVAFSHDND